MNFIMKHLSTRHVKDIVKSQSSSSSLCFVSDLISVWKVTHSTWLNGFIHRISGQKLSNVCWSKSDTKSNYSAWGSSNACWNCQKQVQPNRRHLEVIPLTLCKYCIFIRQNGTVHLHQILQTHCDHITWSTNNTNPLGNILTYA